MHFLLNKIHTGYRICFLEIINVNAYMVPICIDETAFSKLNQFLFNDIKINMVYNSQTVKNEFWTFGFYRINMKQTVMHKIKG